MVAAEAFLPIEEEKITRQWAPKLKTEENVQKFVKEQKKNNAAQNNCTDMRDPVLAAKFHLILCDGLLVCFVLRDLCLESLLGDLGWGLAMYVRG